MSQPDPDDNPNILLNAVLSLLAPMFLWSTGGDIVFARLAAIETLEAYRATGPRSLITATKIIAFELAALWSLSQSMSEDVSLSMTVRLRGNANSMDRAAERNRRTLEEDCRYAESPDLPAEASLDAAVANAQRMVQESHDRIRADRQVAAGAPVATVAGATTDQQWRTAWAAAMTQVAGEITAEMGRVSPKERAADKIRVEALTASAARLVSGAPLPPFPPRRTAAG
nr:hypothetical protein [uncultured Rhodopila sp.]